MDDEIENNKELGEDLNILQQLMIENVLLVKKQLSSRILPVISGIAIVSIIILGLLINVGMLVINVIVAIALVALAGFLFVFRHFFYARSINNVIEYLSTGQPLKEKKSLPYLDKFIDFLSPEEIYEAIKESLKEEWYDLFPIFEAELKRLQQQNPAI